MYNLHFRDVSRSRKRRVRFKEMLAKRQRMTIDKIVRDMTNGYATHTQDGFCPICHRKMQQRFIHSHRAMYRWNVSETTPITRKCSVFNEFFYEIWLATFFFKFNFIKYFYIH